MTAVKWELRPGAYYDSLVLMQLQRGLLDEDGVIDSGVVMATPANRDLLAANGLLPDSLQASADDMLIVVKAKDVAAAQGALSKVDALLARRGSSSGTEDFRPRSLDAAVRQLPDADWVLVSTPGRYAADVARQALELDRHVFLYSDNVSLEDEIGLKQAARSRGLLVMGPDCGTAIINGVGLGFANHVRRGEIGLIAASGTGLQAVTSRLHSLGQGVSQAIGTGGRDLSAPVGAATYTQALDLLRRDPGTKVVVLVAKPPAAEVAARVLSAADSIGKPVVVDFIGYPPPARQTGNLRFALSLEDAAHLAVESAEAHAAEERAQPASGGYLRGLFSGGTLAYEALLALQPSLFPLYSNAPITPTQQLADPLRSQAHTIIDLGDEYFMVGRLHPMIDNDLRIRRMKQEAADPETGLIFLDVVLGEGAHRDPASELGPAIEQLKAQRKELEIVVLVVGTDQDPQGLEVQADRLRAAGAAVFDGLGQALQYTRQRLKHAAPSVQPPVDLDRFTRPLSAINVGLETFYDSLRSQGAGAVHVDWRPPAGGNEQMASILARMRK
jgi:FdrA protein